MQKKKWRNIYLLMMSLQSMENDRSRNNYLHIAITLVTINYQNYYHLSAHFNSK